MTHLILALLGPFQATLDGQPAAALTSPRLRALLAYLAVDAGREHNREALAGLLWPDRPDREALSALRYALANLRRVIETAASPPLLLITRHTVQLNPAGNYWLDVAVFCQTASEAPPEQLAAAISLYRGDFLADLNLNDSPAFEEWLLLQREQYRRQALNLLYHLATSQEQGGHSEAAIVSFRRYLALEPWDESIHRRLMQRLAQSGQRNAALAQYHICRQLLADELGVEPEPHTTRLYQSLRAGEILPRQEADITFTVSPSAPTAAFFVGREPELAQLTQGLNRALTGPGQVMVITGEAGSGKTSLLAEFTRQALSAHPNLLAAGGRGAAYTGAGDPYLPFREILGQLTGDDGGGPMNALPPANQTQRLRAALSAILAALVEAGPGLLDTLLPAEALAQRAEQLLPNGGDWRQKFEHGVNTGPNQQPSTVRQDGLFAQICRLLQAVTRRYPLLLLLDDLQWADQDSISLLFHLSRQLRGSRLLLVCAYRPADLAQGAASRHPLQPVIHEFQREWGDIVIDLDQAEGLAFVNAYLDSEPNNLSNEFRARFCRTVGGNPLFTVELVHRLQEQGYLTRDIAGRWVAGSTINWQRMPARMEAIIAERLTRLPAEWRAMLDVASVAGEEFEAELVARVLNIEALTALHALGGPLSKEQRLVLSGGLNQTVAGQRLSPYRFRHGLFQRYLYHTLDEGVRAGLHQAVGEALEWLHAGDAAALAPRLAWHFEAAGLFDRAAAYCLTAGQHAYRLSAHEEAIGHYRRGLDLLNQLPPPLNPHQQQVRLRRELALQLGLAPLLGVKRGWANPEQVSTYQRAYELAHQLADQGEMTPDFLLALYGQITMATIQSELQQSLTLSTHLLTLAEKNQNLLGLGLAYWGLGSSHLFRGECVLGRVHLEKAIDLYYHHLMGLAEVEALGMGVRCLTWLALDLCFLGYPRQSLARGQEAIALARRSDNPVSLGTALTIGVCSPYICWRQPQEVQRIALELQALAHIKDFLTLLAWLEIALGWCQVQFGEFEAGIVRMERGTRAWQQMGTVMGHFWHMGLLAEAYGQNGQPGPGLVYVEEGLALMQRVGSSQYEPELYRIRGELLRLNPDTAAEAEASFWQAIEISRRHETRWWELRALTSLARLMQEQESASRREVELMLADLLAWFDPGLDLPDLREAQALLGECDKRCPQGRLPCAPASTNSKI